MFTAENLIDIFYEYKNIAFIISIGINVLVSLAGILPSIFITGANIIFFGPVKGVLISVIGETVGGYITFKLYRMGFKSKIEKFEEKNLLIKKILNSKGKKSLFLIFEGRITPFIPSGFVTFASAMSNTNDIYFIIGTLFGKIPSIVLEALISYDLLNIKENYLRLILTILSLILVYITLRADKKLKKK